MKLDSVRATTLSSKSLGQLVQQGPLLINSQTLVVGYDGSLYSIDANRLSQDVGLIWLTQSA